MKITLHIPTEQFGFVEAEEEIDSSIDIDPSKIRTNYESLKSSFAEKPGVSRQEFNKFLDDQLQEKGGDSEVFAAMNRDQLLIVQEVKKAINRVNNK